MTCGYKPPDNFDNNFDKRRGSPREQYERTYVLLPPNAGASWVRAVVRATWNNRRFTVGGSADDAGIGDLNYRKVIAINPRSWPGPQTLEDFFAIHYPGVEYVPIYAGSPKQLEDTLSRLPGIGPSIPEPPELPTPTLRIGFNDPDDQGAGHWMIQNNVRGILYVPTALDYQPRSFDFAECAKSGIDVYVNLRFSWASRDGGQGTLPLLKEQTRFEMACAKTIIDSRGVAGWSLTNEANSTGEWPKKPDGSLESISPARLSAFYDRVAEMVPSNVRLSLGGFDPYTASSGLDPRQWMEITYELVQRKPDFIDVHGYIRGPDVRLINSDAKFDPGILGWQYLNYPKCFLTLLDALPDWAKGLPTICSEFNHLWKTVEPDWGWVNDNRAGEAIRAAIDQARVISLSGLAIYRWKGDKWETWQNDHVKDVIMERSLGIARGRELIADNMAYVY